MPQTIHGLPVVNPQRKEFVDLIDGTAFSPRQTKQFKIATIAHGLAMHPRFGGQTTEQYSVAQHSVLVAVIMERLGWGDPFEGLLHDVSEFALGDMPTPWKEMYTAFAVDELILCERMRQYFGLSRHKSPDCHKVDKMAAFMEAYLYTPNKGENMSDVHGLRDQAIKMLPRFATYLEPISWREAKKRFLDYYRRYEGMSYL